jgi:hypothetical protein
MFLQSIISQFNYQVLENPTVLWNSPTTGNYNSISGIEYITLATPVGENNLAFNHICFAKECYGKIYVMYNTTNQIEGNPGGFVRYQYSDDYGLTWSNPITLFEPQDDLTKNGRTEDGRVIIPAGFVIINGELYAIGDVTDYTADQSSRVGVGEIARKINADNTLNDIYWIDTLSGSFTAPEPISGYPSYTFNESLRALIRDYVIQNPPEQPTRYYGVPDNDPLNTWRTYHNGNQLAEPSIVQLPTGGYLKLWRALSGFTNIKIGQVSDNGVVWGETFATEIPDSPSSTVTLNVDNKILVIGNNEGSTRTPLFLAISQDGLTYNSENIYNVDTENNPAQYPDAFKNIGVQYPAAIRMSNNKILVAYSVNKEDIRIAIFELPEIV